MEVDKHNDSGISPGRTSSEANSNSPNSPERTATTPTEHFRSRPIFYGNDRAYSPPHFGFSRPKLDSSPESNVKSEKIDDSSNKSNDFDCEKDYLNDSGDHQAEDSLERLKMALEKSTALSGIFKARSEDNDVTNDLDNSQDGARKEFPCPLCAYTTPYRHRYMEHLSTHYSDKCTLCDFTGQNVQDLRNHLQDIHNLPDLQDLSDPQDNNSDCQDDEEGGKRGKSKTFKCKQCSYVTTTKLDFWEHSKGHIKAEKLLTCPKCPFVTEYKHHLEYHLRNHFGSKPFKCTKCSYSCVNKSMLNSHLKSHSNVYQYRCSDCAYATKYCHSLKLHLRKYQHKPAMVLNADGSPNPLPIIDVYGTRRGPKQKKSEENEERSAFLDIKIPGKSGPDLPGGVVVPTAPQTSPILFNNNDLKGVFYCNLCEFQTFAPDILNQHMFLHAAESNLAHIFKTNNNLSSMKEYFQNVYQQPFVETEALSPLSLVSPKTQSPVPKTPSTPLDLSKQDNYESEWETPKTEECKKNRRKGKAYKLERLPKDDFKIKIPEFKAKVQEEEPSAKVEEAKKEDYSCGYCDISFKDVIMYTMHMGYHGYHDPFTCNMCGQVTEDKVSFFLHIARSSHL